MIVYKLVREMKDGSLAPLFINKKLRFILGEWLDAELIPTKGFLPRRGFHCCTKPEAPHLSKKGRVWIECEVPDNGFTVYQRPESQGGTWVLAERIKPNRVIE